MESPSNAHIVVLLLFGVMLVFSPQTCHGASSVMRICQSQHSTEALMDRRSSGCRDYGGQRVRQPPAPASHMSEHQNYKGPPPAIF
ncbi:hypothetical protein Acr_08g0012940 [Actinidia rufa]|uniref:Uncharacterized protein n=1 Tax=Actinidia rufa TaxID=165716 RepID=A0A7J0F2H0_9ERIC|nr:hypothetical protein Acr_08g0012940 [Actinidia rufa]